MITMTGKIKGAPSIKIIKECPQNTLGAKARERKSAKKTDVNADKIACFKVDQNAAHSGSLIWTTPLEYRQTVYNGHTTNAATEALSIIW